MNRRWIIVFDWETDGKDPYSCNPVELAAVPVDPRTLDIKEDRAFKAVIKPDDYRVARQAKRGRQHRYN